MITRSCDAWPTPVSTPATLPFTQPRVGSANALGKDFRFGARQPPCQFLERAGTNALGLDHEADRRTMLARNGVADVRHDREQFAVAVAAVGGGQPQAALECDIDVQRARATLARTAEQPGVEHALGRNQHQMAGFAGLGVHGSSSPRGSFWAAAMGQP